MKQTDTIVAGNVIDATSGLFSIALMAWCSVTKQARLIATGRNEVRGPNFERWDHRFYERVGKARFGQRLVMVKTLCQMEFAPRLPRALTRDRAESDIERDRR